MLLRMIKSLMCVMATLVLACLASAQQISVTSPSNGDYLGLSNTLTFHVSGETLQTTVTATITGPNGSSTSSNKFTPSSSGTIDGSLPIDFNSSSPAGDYTISVTGTASGATFNTVTVTVHVIVKGPTFLDFFRYRATSSTARYT